MENNEIATKDDINNILEAIQSFAGTVDDNFVKIDDRFTKIDTRLNSIDSRLTRVEATMVTKEYLDDKLAVRKADLIAIDRKQDEKTNLLTRKLADKKLLSEKEATEIIRLGAFPVPPVVAK